MSRRWRNMKRLVVRACRYCALLFGRAAARATRRQIRHLRDELRLSEERCSALSSENYRLERLVDALRDEQNADSDTFDARVSKEVRGYLDYLREEEADSRQQGWLPCASCATWDEPAQAPVCMRCQALYRALEPNGEARSLHARSMRSCASADWAEDVLLDSDAPRACTE